MFFPFLRGQLSQLVLRLCQKFVILYQFLPGHTGICVQRLFLLYLLPDKRFALFQSLAQGTQNIRADFQRLLLLLQGFNLHGQRLPVDVGKIVVFEQQLQLKLAIAQLFDLLGKASLGCGRLLNKCFQCRAIGFQRKYLLPVAPAKNKTGAIVYTKAIVFFMTTAATFNLAGGGNSASFPAKILQLVTADKVKALGQFLFQPGVKLAVCLNGHFATQRARINTVNGAANRLSYPVIDQPPLEMGALYIFSD